MEKGFIIALIFAIIIAVFALNNGETVMIDFLFTEVRMSQAIVIFGSSILGAVIMAILGAVRNFKLKRENKEITSELVQLRDEKINLEILLEDRIKEISKLKEQ